MFPPRVWLNYRPVRIGWIVSGRSLDDFDKAVRLSCCLWGGRFNPMIPAHDSELARNLVRAFGVDLLIPMRDTPEANALIDEFPYLIPGILGHAVFTEDGKKRCLYSDIYHPSRKLYEQSLRTASEAETAFTRPVWDPADSLASVLLAMFGDYPEVAQTGIDYRSMLDQWLKAENYEMGPQDTIDPSLYRRPSPLGLTSYELRRTRREGWRAPGVVIGQASSADDLILFWNLRAADAPVWFYDTSHSQRLRPWIDTFLGGIEESEFEGLPRLNIWTRQKQSEHDLNLEGLEAARCVERDASTWNGLNINPPRAQFNDWHIDVLPAYSEDADGRTVSFALPEKPFYTDDPHVFNQQFVVTASDLPPLTGSKD